MGAGVQRVRSGSRRGRRGRQSSGGALMSEINVTPFVDVMLVLLIIFMVTAPLLTAGINVDLPEADVAPISGDDEPITIGIKSDGTVYIQKTKISVKDLAAKLQAITGRNKDTRIFVKGDRAAGYGHIMRVLGTVNSAGYNKVSLIAENVE